MFAFGSVVSLRLVFTVCCIAKGGIFSENYTSSVLKCIKIAFGYYQWFLWQKLDVGFATLRCMSEHSLLGGETRTRIRIKCAGQQVRKGCWQWGFQIALKLKIELIKNF